MIFFHRVFLVKVFRTKKKKKEFRTNKISIDSENGKFIIFIRMKLFMSYFIRYEESVSFIHKIFSTESVFYRKYKDLIKSGTKIRKIFSDSGF